MYQLLRSGWCILNFRSVIGVEIVAQSKNGISEEHGRLRKIGGVLHFYGYFIMKWLLDWRENFVLY